MVREFLLFLSPIRMKRVWRSVFLGALIGVVSGLVSNQSNFPVVDGAGELKGILSLTDLRRVMLEKGLHRLVVAKDLATLDVLTVTPMDDLNTALKKMTEAEIRELPVVAEEGGCPVISMLSRKEIIRTYHDEIEKIKVGRNKNSAKG